MGLNTAEISLRFNANITGSNDLGNPVFNPQLSKALQFAGGTLANQADICFTDTRTIADGGTDSLDLAGVLTNAFGQVITAAEVVAVIIVARAANTTILSVGGGSNAWFGMFGATGDIIKVPPGGMFAIAAPDANGLGSVTAGTGDILQIVNAAGAAATYDIVILARSA